MFPNRVDLVYLIGSGQDSGEAGSRERERLTLLKQLLEVFPGELGLLEDRSECPGGDVARVHGNNGQSRRIVLMLQLNMTAFLTPDEEACFLQCSNRLLWGDSG